MEPLVGHRLAKYQILEEIGRGGMGTVYKGYDPILDRFVAVKVLALHLTAEKQFVQRFLREARAAARLNHSNIVTIYDVGQDGKWYYFVMEYLEGPSLRDLIRQRGPLPVDEALTMLRQLADALDYAHQEGLIHRDVKPGNILFGPRQRVTLTDFGLAKAAYEGKGAAGELSLGTPEYMAPEQISGDEVGPWTDLYALGVVAYEMLAGQPPSVDTLAPSLLYQVLHEPPPSIRNFRPELSPVVDEVIARALAKEPRARYPDAATFIAALGAMLLGVLEPLSAIISGLPTQVPSTEPSEAAEARTEDIGVRSVPDTIPEPAVFEEQPLADTLVEQTILAAPPVSEAVLPELMAEEIEPAPAKVREQPVRVAEGVQPVPAERPERRRGFPVWLWIVVVGGVIGLVVGGLALAGAGPFQRQATPTATVTPTLPPPTPTLPPPDTEVPVVATATAGPTEPTMVSTTPAAPTETALPATATSAPTIVEATEPPTPVPTRPSVVPTATPAPPTQPPPTQPPPTQPPPTQPPPTQPPPTQPPPTNTPVPPTPTLPPPDTPVPPTPTLPPP